MGEIIVNVENLKAQIGNLEALAGALSSCPAYPGAGRSNDAAKQFQATYEQLLKARGEMIQMISKTIALVNEVSGNFGTADQ